MIRSFAALGFAALALFATPAFAQEARLTRTLSLTGHGEVSAVPDTAVVNAGVMSSAATAREALDANNKAMTDIMAALKEAGIAAADIQTSNFMVAPRLDFGQNNTGQPPRVVGYDVSNTVAITMRKLADLGPVLDRLVSLGSNQINGITFSIADPEPLRDQARKLAVADAQRKASLYASAANIALGPIVSIAEAGGMQPPVPVFKAARMDAASAVPVAEGGQLVSVDVNITWDIK